MSLIVEYPLSFKDTISTDASAIAAKASIVWYPWPIPSANTLGIIGLSTISPRGDIIPFIIINAKAIRRAGVKNCPTISTTLEGLIVSTYEIAKKSIQNNNTGIEVPNKGIIPIS